MTKIKVDFAKGCANVKGEEKTLYIDRKGVWYPKKIGKRYLTSRNCEVL